MERVILHLDMDAFYASVEQMDNPELRGRPVIVGGTSNRGVVSAASYEARKFGIHSAMPIFQAKKRCPKAVFRPVRMGRYKEVSEQVMAILESYSPLIEQVSIDEAYMDISGLDRLYGSHEAIARKLKQGIKQTTSLSCSIGIAPNKVLAKIASDMHKPDGLTIIAHSDVDPFIARLPIKQVPGVGKKTAQRLRNLGVITLGDIRRITEHTLSEKIGKFGSRLLALCKGIDDSPVVPYREAKSISSEETLRADTSDMELLKQELLAQAEIVGRRLRNKGLKGGTVTVKLKRSDFTLITRSLTLEASTHSTNTLYERGLQLLEEFDLSGKFRLIGIGVSNLVSAHEAPKQLSLFDKGDSRAKSWGDVEKAVDVIRDRFGRDAIKRGGLV
ncbi:MAG: DNA polymerase IV [Desulfobacteraceae bacterium]|jgi:DNA polymerase-4